MRLSAAMLVGLVLGALLPGGCGPPVPPDDLGTVLDQAPEFPAEGTPADPTKPVAAPGDAGPSQPGE
jgi:hypothetical protein